MKAISLRWAILAVSILATATAPTAENLKITPLGSHDGEFCRFDRALILEDPDGTRLLYDAGHTVAGPDDPRLGKIDVVLVSHMHGDDVGDRRIASVNAGECGKPDTRISAAPNMLDAAGLTAYAGPPTGYVLTFSNGLVVYLSDDTGITAEQDSVVRRHYGAKLVVMNIGDTFTTGQKEAAYVVNELIKPSAVIASHANETATQNGRVVVGTRTESFISASAVPVHLPLSGRTMEFDGDGTCVTGC